MNIYKAGSSKLEIEKSEGKCGIPEEKKLSKIF